ncbi:phage tail protein [Burkholderia ubonensis]|nr:phage tail protein [Burkholderia ubonensis]
MSVTAASASATLTADEIIVESALGGLRYCLASFNKTINLATTGAGGMDTGSAPVSGFVAIYAIYNPTTQTAALLATNATAAAAPNVYGGANMPAGYSASALVSVWPTNASSQFIVGSQFDRRLNFVATSALNGAGTVGSATSFSLASIIPKNAKFVSGSVSITVNAAAISTLTIYDQLASGASSVVASNNSGAGAAGASSNFSNFPVLTAQTLWYSTTTSAGSITNYNMSVTQYEF